MRGVEHLAGAVGCGTALKGGRLRVRFPVWSLDFLFYFIPSGLTVAQPVTQSARNISEGGGEGDRCVGLTSPPSGADCVEIGSLNLRSTKGDFDVYVTTTTRYGLVCHVSMFAKRRFCHVKYQRRAVLLGILFSMFP